MWRPTLDELHRIDDRRRVLTLDLPGHGGSADVEPWGVLEGVRAVHRAVVELDLRAPILVGHSISGMIATLYAALHPTSGIINVDCSLDVEPFAAMMCSVADQVTGPGFAAVWEQLAAGFHTELLPDAAQDLLRACTPRQEVFVAYQSELLIDSPGRMADLTMMALASLRAGDVPYRVVAGDEQPDGYERWLRDALPRSTIEVWPRSGHFPHLAHPARFAAVLNDTADWPRRDRWSQP
jgi:pimeloyl-ACP methyl ester carboxylesterase